MVRNWTEGSKIACGSDNSNAYSSQIAENSRIQAASLSGDC